MKRVKKLIEDICRTVGHEEGRVCSRCGTAAVPVGTILPVAGKAPAGYLPCDGQLVSSKTYPTLAKAMGSYYGGDEDDFYLPDLRGKVAGTHSYVIKAG